MPEPLVDAARIHDHVVRLGDRHPPIPLESVDYTVRDVPAVRSRFADALGFWVRVKAILDVSQENLYRIDPDVPRVVVVGEVWPEQYRKWVSEDRQRSEKLWRDDGWTAERPFSAELSDELENEMNTHLQSAGLPPRRAGGTWHVRLPGSWTSLNKYLASVFRRPSAPVCRVIPRNRNGLFSFKKR